VRADASPRSDKASIKCRKFTIELFKRSAHRFPRDDCAKLKNNSQTGDFFFWTNTVRRGSGQTWAKTLNKSKSSFSRMTFDSDLGFNLTSSVCNLIYETVSRPAWDCSRTYKDQTPNLVLPCPFRVLTNGTWTPVIPRSPNWVISQSDGVNRPSNPDQLPRRF
jgi:hypothetical protein